MGIVNTPVSKSSDCQPVEEQSSPERLYGEIGRLKMELDWLKKKSGLGQ
jgi:transposase